MVINRREGVHVCLCIFSPSPPPTFLHFENFPATVSLCCSTKADFSLNVLIHLATYVASESSFDQTFFLTGETKLLLLLCISLLNSYPIKYLRYNSSLMHNNIINLQTHTTVFLLLDNPYLSCSALNKLQLFAV